MEHEYWSIVNSGADGPDGLPSLNEKDRLGCKTTIQYAADLPAHRYGSGFPLYESKKSRDENFDYFHSYFNLNNVYKSPMNILQIAEQNKESISGVTIPWVYMGMRFSSFCWHVEDLWLSSINYNHQGGIKNWYILPES